MKKIFSLSAILLFTLIAQYSFAGVVNVRFANENIDANNYCTTVQVKAQDIPFEIGSATVFFEYNKAAVANPTYTALTFNESNACAFNGSLSVYKNNFTALEAGNKGEGNYSILLTVPNEGCPTVTNNEWLNVAEFCFDILDATISPDITISTEYTAFNTVDNEGNQHELGDVQGVVGINDNAATTSNVNIFPNYTQNLVQVEYTTKMTSDVTITVYDMLGRNLSTQSIEAAGGLQQTAVDFSKYGNGYYLIEVDNGIDKVSEKILLAK
ncbi:MAG: T9SS type A sorting domain-containing protein [Chitinophagales bacterium]